ncbi:MAG: type II toxin-antitoxin system VapC family toxin [Acidobacteriota bacterium]
MIVPDINLLVYAYNESAPHHREARDWWEYLLSHEGLVGVPWAVVLGFVRLVTHRQVLVDPMPVRECCTRVAEWFERPNVQPLEPGHRHLKVFNEFLAKVGTGGSLVTDAHIAALVVEHSCELHSNDTDFARFPGLKWINPLTERYK